MSQMTDALIIHEIRAAAKIGCTPDERKAAQALVVNLRIGIDAAQPARSAALEDSVCYKTATEKVRALLASREWTLIEETTEAIAQEMLRAFHQAINVSVQVQKFAAAGIGWAAIEIFRERTAA